MHGVQEMGGGVRRAAPVVLHSTMREMVVHLPRVHSTAFAHELQQEFRLFAAGSGPGTTAFGGDTRIRAGGHQRLYGTCNEAGVDEGGFFVFQLWGAAVAGAGTGSFDA